jgi:ABC-type transport system involved in cytochrome c biogenesis permease subunit
MAAPMDSGRRLPSVRLAVMACVLLAVAAAGSAQEAGGADAGAARVFEPGELRVADLGPLQRIVVVEGGRTMPLDSYARFTLLRLSGRRTFERRPAIEWLARVLFTPNETHDDQIFVVDNPEVIDAMGLPSRGRDRYSLSFLLPGLDELERLATDVAAIGEDNRTIVEREILRLWNNVGLYANLLSAFAFTYPHRDFQVDDAGVADLLGLPGPGTYSYLDIALRRGELREAATSAGLAHARSGAFSRADGLLVRLSQSLAAWQGNFVGLPPAIIPVGGFGDARWLTPWQALDGQQVAALGSEQRRALEAELLALRDLQVAYIEGRDLRFSLAARQFADSVQRRAAAELDIQNPALEILYNRTNPYFAARLAYGGGLLLLGLSFLGFRKWLYLASVVLLVAGFVPHTFGLLLRILITDRPPVTNLFETFVFVGWCSVVCGLVMEHLRKRYLGVFSGLAGGFVFFLLSGKFAAEDTMPVLQAVLDTNFWLSTHVTVITAGYMACCVAGLIGHVYMVQAILHGRGGRERSDGRDRVDDKRLAHTYRTMFGTLALGLTFSFIGTMLGGVWADQSWGRFWGWDPKENGALLIVLWCAILFHARMGKMIGPFGMAAGSALLIVVVMMAWFGINLLGVGLHSYGFIDGVLLGLLAYSVLQVGVVAVLAGWYRRQRRGSMPPASPPPGAAAAAAGTANGTAHAAAARDAGSAESAAAAAADR